MPTWGTFVFVHKKTPIYVKQVKLNSFAITKLYSKGLKEKKYIHDISLFRHGLSRTDYHIVFDTKLCFREIIQKKQAQLASTGGGDKPSIHGQFGVVASGKHSGSQLPGRGLVFYCVAN